MAENKWFALTGRIVALKVEADGDGQRFVVRADEKLTAFMELELAICACGEFT